MPIVSTYNLAYNSGTPQRGNMMARRVFNANPPQGIERCSAVVTLRDKTTADCMRRAVAGGRLCRQHLVMRDAEDARRYRALRAIALGDDLGAWDRFYFAFDSAFVDCDRRFDGIVDQEAAAQANP